MIVFRDRASTVLYEVLSTLDNHTKFLLPVNICPVVPETFLKANIKFDFIDINLKTLCMDEVLALKSIKNDSSISGVLFVNTFGVDVEVEEFFQKLKNINPDIFIIYDQCLSIQDFEFNPDESLSSLALYSSGYSKYVDLGYGGYGFLKDNEFNETFKDNSKDKSFLEYKVNVKNRISLMQKHKSKLNSIYKKGIPSCLHLGQEFENWRFSILIDEKDKLLEAIFKEEDLFASSHYEPLDHKYSDNPIINSNAKVISSRIVNLFNDFRFTDEKAKRVVKIINSFINDRRKLKPK
jgi:dTDP-4-amino-4,6-dideoxygalactose transaminase